VLDYLSSLNKNNDSFTNLNYSQNMKSIFLFLAAMLLFAVSCTNVSKEAGNIATVSDSLQTIKVDTGEYKIVNEKLIPLHDGIKIAFLMTEDGRYIAKAKGGPVYECYCQGTGSCSIEPEPRGILNCCCNNSCAKKQGDVTNATWRKLSADAVTNIDEIILDNKIDMLDSLPKENPFNAEGFRVVGNGVLEFEKPGLFKIVENAGKKEVILLKAAPQNNKITCDCSCDSGDCQVTGGETYISCRYKTRCLMVINGNPCNGCEWSRVAATGKN
jgi:hypothetical protein